MVAGAGNRAEDRGITKEMSSALANRFAHFDVEHSLLDWQDWAYCASVYPLLIAYHRYKSGESLYSFDPKKNEKAYPTPRSWERVSDVMKVSDGVVPSDVVQGLVGIGAGIEFEAFAELESLLPDIEAVMGMARRRERIDFPSVSGSFRKKKEHKCIDDDGRVTRTSTEFDFSGASVLYIMLAAIAARASKNTAGEMWHIANELTREDTHKDFAVFFVTDCMRKDRQVMCNHNDRKDLMDWSRKNIDLAKSLMPVGKNI
jgi:hypothetical protein